MFLISSFCINFFNFTIGCWIFSMSRTIRSFCSFINPRPTILFLKCSNIYIDWCSSSIDIKCFCCWHTCHNFPIFSISTVRMSSILHFSKSNWLVIPSQQKIIYWFYFNNSFCMTLTHINRFWCISWLKRTSCYFPI